MEVCWLRGTVVLCLLMLFSVFINGGSGRELGSLVQPSASSPRPWRKMNVAGFEVWARAPILWGGFCAMTFGKDGRDKRGVLLDSIFEVIL